MPLHDSLERLAPSRRGMLAGTALALGLGWARLAVAADRIVLHRGNGAEPGSLDPHRIGGTWEDRIVGDMIMGLMTEDEAGRPVYGAAVSHTVSEDGLVWTFKLREGALWSDGTPVTAHDFQYSWRRILDPAMAAEYAFILHPVKNAREVNFGEKPVDELGAIAKDDMTFEVTLAHPAPYLLEMVTHQAFFPVPRHVVEKFGADWIKAENYVVNGPYRLVDWRPNDKITLTRNEKFYDNANVKVDEVVFYSISDTNAALRRFRAGELDMNTGWPVVQGPWLKDHMAGETRREPSLSNSYVVCNLKRPPFDDVRVRKALALAIDRPTISDKVFLGFGGLPAEAFVPTGIANYPGTSSLGFGGMAFPERQAEARRLLSEAGFGPGKALAFSYTYRSGSDDAKRYAVALQAMWKSVGIEAALDPREPKVAYDLFKQKDYTVGDAGWVADFNDPINFLVLMHSKSAAYNYAAYNNPKFDALLDAADLEVDLTKRGQFLSQAEELLLSEVGVIPVSFGVNRNLVATHVTGYVANVGDKHRTRWLGVEAVKAG